MKDTMFADIILPFAFAGTFTYIVPTELQPEITIGKRVIVPFGKSKYFSGLVCNLHHTKPSEFEVKEILSVLDEQPITEVKQLDFWKWIANYYLCTLGEVYKAAMPSSFRLESETLVSINGLIDHIPFLSNKEDIVFAALQSGKVLNIEKISKLLNVKNVIPIVKSLIDKNIISTEENIQDLYKPKLESWIQLTETFQNNISGLDSVIEKLKKSPVQNQVLSTYLHLSDYTDKPILRKNILFQVENSNSAIKSLIAKGIFKEFQIEISRLASVPDEDLKVSELNLHQQKAYSLIVESFETKDITLLHGVTSSGKTEIYLKLIRNYIEQGKQILFLLPEIALTTQMIVRLKDALGNKVGIYHSMFTDSERVEIWKSVIGINKKVNYSVILGTRSAVLLPFVNLGLIIIDEEHESSYKQLDPAPRYHARDAALILAKIHNAKTLLGSASPSVESWYNAVKEKYALVELKNRFQYIELPKIVLIDIRPIYYNKRMMSHFSPYLINNMRDALSRKEQIILFQNRRGFSPYIECDDCGWIPRCKRCNISLTYHKSANTLNCHLCGYNVNILKSCAECNSTKVFTKGFGTERVEDEIAIYFPEAKLSRLDFDSAKTKRDYERIIQNFENRSTDILIGTQMVTKGLDFSHVSIVAVLNADNMLNFSDYRAFERCFQILVQVSGRAGRRGSQGKVIVQTSHPQHPVIKDFLYNDFYNFYNNQVTERKDYNYPPFSRLIKIIIKHRKEEIAHQGALELLAKYKSMFGENVLGPETPVVDKIQNNFIRNIIIKLPKNKNLPASKFKIQSVIKELKYIDKYKQLFVVVDVDPV